MINSLQLGNFKAFAETQEIPVKPITLIFGANSAGKSSIIHSLALVHEALRTGKLDLFRTDIGGSSVDLGGFRQYIHRRQANRRMDWRITLNTAKFQGRLNELLKPVSEITAGVTIGMPLDDMDQPLLGASPQVFSYELESEGKRLLRMSRRPAGHLALDLLPYKHLVLQRIIKALLEGFTTTGKMTDKDVDDMEAPIAEIIANLRAPMGAFFPKGLKDHSREEEGEARQLSLFPISKGYRQEDLAKALHFFLPRTLDELVRGLNTQLQSEINRLQYLGPLRSYPARHFAFAEHEDVNWYAGGGYAWDVARRNQKVRNKVNTWLGDKEKLSTPYELSIKNLLTIDDLNSDYDKIISALEENVASDKEEAYGGDLFGYLYVDVMKKIKEREEDLSNVQELVLIDKRADTQVSHRDVGIGVSQVLPVLVSAYAFQEKLIAIEQPEIHLHPALQAELGDVFIESSLGESKNKFIIETHSEHLILRLLKRIRQTTRNQNNGMPKISPNDIALLYINGTPKGSTVQELRVDERGRLIDQCPGGFFEEDFEELF